METLRASLELLKIRARAAIAGEPVESSVHVDVEPVYPHPLNGVPAEDQPDLGNPGLVVMSHTMGARKSLVYD